MQHRLAFVDMKYFFVQHQHVFVDIKLLFAQRQTFCFNTKIFFVEHQIFVLDIVKNVMMIHFYCHIATKTYDDLSKNKLSFLWDTRKLVSFFVHHNFFRFSFYITHCQHVDLLRSGPGNK